jgi:hypothetical protein
LAWRRAVVANFGELLVDFVVLGGFLFDVGREDVVAAFGADVIHRLSNGTTMWPSSVSYDRSIGTTRSACSRPGFTISQFGSFSSS